MTENTNVLLVTVDNDPDTYEAGREAIERLADGESLDRPVTIRFPNESRLTEVFNERTYTLIRVIRDEAPASIRETARLVGRDVKNVHKELTTLEALGVIEFEDEGRAKRPVFPYDDLVVTPLAHDHRDGSAVTP